MLGRVVGVQSSTFMDSAVEWFNEMSLWLSLSVDSFGSEIRASEHISRTLCAESGSVCTLRSECWSCYVKNTGALRSALKQYFSRSYLVTISIDIGVCGCVFFIVLCFSFLPSLVWEWASCFLFVHRPSSETSRTTRHKTIESSGLETAEAVIFLLQQNSSMWHIFLI